MDMEFGTLGSGSGFQLPLYDNDNNYINYQIYAYNDEGSVRASVYNGEVSYSEDSLPGGSLKIIVRKDKGDRGIIEVWNESGQVVSYRLSSYLSDEESF